MESRPAGTNPFQLFPYVVLSASINWSHFRQARSTHLPFLLALGQGGERFSQDFHSWFFFPFSIISIGDEAWVCITVQVNHKLCY